MQNRNGLARYCSTSMPIRCSSRVLPEFCPEFIMARKSPSPIFSALETPPAWLAGCAAVGWSVGLSSKIRGSRWVGKWPGHGARPSRYTNDAWRRRHAIRLTLDTRRARTKSSPARRMWHFKRKTRVPETIPFPAAPPVLTSSMSGTVPDQRQLVLTAVCRPTTYSILLVWLVKALYKHYTGLTDGNYHNL